MKARSTQQLHDTSFKNKSVKARKYPRLSKTKAKGTTTTSKQASKQTKTNGKTTTKPTNQQTNNQNNQPPQKKTQQQQQQQQEGNRICRKDANHSFFSLCVCVVFKCCQDINVGHLYLLFTHSRVFIPFFSHFFFLTCTSCTIPLPLGHSRTILLYVHRREVAY